MPLDPGTRLGSYEILSAIGAGGMGEVYRARDTKLDRDVAIKVLPEAFAADPERIARFQREAKTLAALNHPHIAAIYGIEDGPAEAGPHVRALVMELVEGEDLSQRIARGPIAVDEALAIAKQIAEALEAAHEQGIIHRDLKPANIKVRPDGAVKVLDFGLAKLNDPDASNVPNGPNALSMSPTITSPAMMTGVGVLLGTAAYMSPEQARGQVVDNRSDIWAFGCVLFEMLSGVRAFAGTNTTDTIAAIIRAEPEWTRLPPDCPRRVLRALRRCLAKDRTRRLADIRDVKLELDDTGDVSSAGADSPTHSHVRERLGWVTACTVCALVAGGLVSWRDGRAVARTAPSEIRAEITTPPTTDEVSFALSPDGQMVAFVASSEGRPTLWLRSLTTGVARPLAGTDGASFPFWSPDNHSVGFFANDSVNRVDVDGGSLRALASAPVGSGGTWSRDGVILFTLVPDAPISRVSATGGRATLLPGARPGQPGHRFPSFLPDGDHFLFYVADTAERGVYLGALDGPQTQRLLDADSAAIFAPPSQLLFVRAGKLWTQRFDPVRLQLEGTAAPIADGVIVDAVGVAAVSASGDGSIAYRIGGANRQRQLVWFDRSGKQLGVAGAPDPANVANPSLSPDGRRVAMNRSINGNADIWLYELERHVFTRFTFAGGPDIDPVWSPDGRRIAYGSFNRHGRGFNVFQKAATDEGDGSPLLDTAENMVPLDWSHDGRFILFMRQATSGSWDLGALPTDGDRKPFLVTQTPYDERAGQFSPDGKSIAFESNESGRYEIYVQPFPGSGAKTIVSTGGGIQPRWGADAKELFYVAPDRRLMVVPLRFQQGGQTIEPGSPTALFTTGVVSTETGGSSQEYMVSTDGKRFLVNTLTEQAGLPITLVLKH